jgi:hypothetical protein
LFRHLRFCTHRIKDFDTFESAKSHHRNDNSLSFFGSWIGIRQVGVFASSPTTATDNCIPIPEAQYGYLSHGEIIHSDRSVAHIKRAHRSLHHPVNTLSTVMKWPVERNLSAEEAEAEGKSHRDPNKSELLCRYEPTESSVQT